VGLTAGVHMDPMTKEWTLEGGALVRTHARTLRLYTHIYACTVVRTVLCPVCLFYLLKDLGPRSIIILPPETSS
jgi:hypothetical protein